uniref:Uncharacterized protein n=1 Tax=Ralstonia solanacearum TaxID=305 RepID=A0A0S4V0S8_RALSL|nr:protein of unknown function [Ralstonia solanacearum]CUV27918.1 protein of unknown function [Ralstonia solanacearum]
MVPGRHAQPGMAVDDARVPGRDRDIRQQAGHQPRAHRRAMHGADNGLVAVDEVVDQVARLVPDAGAHLEVIGHLLDQVQVAAGRKAPALAADQRHAHRWLGRHVAPDLGQLAMQTGVGGGQLAVGRLRRPHHDLEDGAVLHERQRLVTGKAWGERVHGVAECASSIADREDFRLGHRPVHVEAVPGHPEGVVAESLDMASLSDDVRVQLGQTARAVRIMVLHGKEQQPHGIPRASAMQDRRIGCIFFRNAYLRK